MVEFAQIEVLFADQAALTVAVQVHHGTRLRTLQAYQHFGVAAPRTSPTGDLWDN